MCRKVFILITICSFILIIFACASPAKNGLKHGSEIQTDSNEVKVAKYTLKVAHRKDIMIGDKNYHFELLRINSQNNVTLELEKGKKLHLTAQQGKSFQYDGAPAAVTFELSRVIQDQAIINVRQQPYTATVPRPEKPAEIIPDVADETKRIRLNLSILEDTIIKLVLDDQTAKEIPLPKGTQVNWVAEHNAEIELLEAGKAILDINGTLYKTSNDDKGLHLYIIIEAGKLVVETR